jgi:8-oxo-dGTP pyrophosphatase MutT (NUDIX family)
VTDLPPQHEDLADVLTQALWAKVRAAPPTTVRPRKAATLILLDHSGPQVRLLMGKRHEGHSFLPGVFVFPGGGVEPGDRQMAIAGALDPITEAKLMACLDRPSPGGARALALAAIRETFEETGLALGVGDYGAPENPPAGGWTSFAAQGVYPNLEDLHFIARAITPPRLKKRFDTFFFAADASGVAARLEGVVGEASELVELVWVTITEAQSLSMPLITNVVLKELAARLEKGMSRFLPVPVYRTGRKGWLRLEA